MLKDEDRVLLFLHLAVDMCRARFYSNNMDTSLPADYWHCESAKHLWCPDYCWWPTQILAPRFDSREIGSEECLVRTIKGIALPRMSPGRITRGACWFTIMGCSVERRRRAGGLGSLKIW
ncbi:hypothetical protein FRC08_018615 [Ceratobasidium sp. 394]|nr:hypothetical protein FRC08_018615 [Ceratobasidium sp. 394]KAG9078167.1 hypothetical protein FS749_009860 [Ceratobasidium sp. UAMH 11750]